MNTKKIIHTPRVILIVDGLNRRILLGRRLTSRWDWKESYGLARESFPELAESMLIPIPHEGLEVGVYRGPGPFSRLRQAIVFAHILARTNSDTPFVRYLPMNLLEHPIDLPPVWGRFPARLLPTIRYGRKPNITKSAKH
ncbi:hypothetical protein HZA86_05005 [Candidatus Uhrbacteria bacterium]|nr:hypothetical protein [Candidatus Uhrbacteria bacterium]